MDIYFQKLLWWGGGNRKSPNSEQEWRCVHDYNMTHYNSHSLADAADVDSLAGFPVATGLLADLQLEQEVVGTLVVPSLAHATHHHLARLAATHLNHASTVQSVAQLHHCHVILPYSPVPTHTQRETTYNNNLQ